VARRCTRPTDGLRFECGYPSQVPLIFLKVRLKWPGRAVPQGKNSPATHLRYSAADRTIWSAGLPDFAEAWVGGIF